ncbi:MAG: radical SAM protein [Candidatus Micrarchaeota archaeon]
MSLIQDLRNPSKAQLGAHTWQLREKLGHMVVLAETVSPRVHSIMVTTGCDHGCRFCYLPSVPHGRGESISLETIRKAIVTLGLYKSPVLTGGEPLDHPDIAAIVTATNGKIDFTNGFSTEIQPQRCVEILNKVSNRIQAVSFSIHEKDAGSNPGRDIVLKHAVLTRPEPYTLKFLVEFGKGYEILDAWLDTLLTLVCDKQIQSAMRENVSVSNHIAALPGIQLINFNPSPIAKVGRGLKLDGIYVGDEISFIPEAFDSVDKIIGGSVLFPDGRLASLFLQCSGQMTTNIFATLDDAPDVQKRALRSMLNEYLSEKLARSDEAFEREAHHYFEREFQLLNFLIEFLSTFRRPDIKKKLVEIKDAIAKAIGIPPKRCKTLVDRLSDRVIDEEIKKVAEGRSTPPIVEFFLQNNVHL